MTSAVAASVSCPQIGTSTSGMNHLKPNLTILVVISGDVDWSAALSRCGRGAMKTVIGWLKFLAIVCSVASGNAVS